MITLVRNVTTDQFVNALNEELVPKLQAAGADVAVMGQLGELFQGRPLTKDSAVVISWKLPNTLQASLTQGTLPSSLRPFLARGPPPYVPCCRGPPSRPPSSCTQPPGWSVPLPPSS